MSCGFVSGDRKQLLLLPPSVDKWVPKNHVVRFVHDIIKQMTLTSCYSAYGTDGRPPYDPAMMLSVLVYACCQGDDNYSRGRMPAGASSRGYRVIHEIQDDTLLVLVVCVGHRQDACRV